MGQIAIYLDDDLEKMVDRAAKLGQRSRSAWVKEAILEKIHGAKLTEAWFQLWGTWEDERSTEEILKDIDQGALERERLPIK